MRIAIGLRPHESGTPVEKTTRKMDVVEPTCHRWKKKLAGLFIAEVRRFKQLGEKNKKLSQWVAGLSLRKKSLRDIMTG